MVARARIFRRTEAGRAACEDHNSGLPAQYRAILGVIDTDTHSDVLRGLLCRRYSETQIVEWVAELLTLGFVQSVPETAEHGTDFTSGFSVSDLAAAFNAALSMPLLLRRRTSDA
jgi:hypothetical protein